MLKNYRLTSLCAAVLVCLFADFLSLGSKSVNAQEVLPLEDPLTTESVDQPADMEQLNSVSQLRDVEPTDWAYEALKSLVERYGCIVGYPDGTFRGNRPLSRWEFAAGLNSCLSSIEGLIQKNATVAQEDLEKLRVLTQQFQTELTALGARVDKLEDRTKLLEDRNFSVTTKLSGEVIFSVSGATGGEPNSKDPQITFNDRVRLNLTTSFTGKDTLITGLQAYNFKGGSIVTGSAGVNEILFPNDGSPLSEGMTKLNYEPQFPGFNPENLSPGCGNNGVCLYKLLYITPVTDNLTVFIGPKAETSDALPAIVPFASEGQGVISRFGALNPVVRVSGGTSGSGLAAAAGFIFTPIPEVDLRALYGSVNPAIPNNDGFPTTPLGSGLFNGSYVISTQLTLKPTETLDIGLNYAHSYHQINITGIGSSGSSTGVLGGLPLTTPVTMNSFGATLTWRFSKAAYFTTYGAYIMVEDAAGSGAYTDLTSWMVGFYFPDALVEGNTAGILVGQPLYRVSAGKGATLTPANIRDRALPIQIEAYYNFKVNDNISITPGAFVIFNAEGDGANDTTAVAALRTTFTF